MSFIHRPMRLEDLEACFEITQGRFMFGSAGRKQLLSLWRHLLDRNSCVAAVVEDRRLPKGRRVAAFGFSVFMSDDFAQSAQKSLPPFLPLRMIEAWKKGDGPFLLRKEIQSTNAKGINCANLNYGWDEKRLSPEDVFRVRHFLQDLFSTYHGGYRIKEVLMECYGPRIRDEVIISGVSLRRDFHEFKGTAYLKGVAEKDHPFLLGFTPAEAMSRGGTHIARILAKTFVPRFGFNPGQKAVLKEALSGKTDEDIAQLLRLSPWTVKRRFQALYDRVMKMDPELLNDPSGIARTEGGPQRQRRRYLLEYLRSHPEELGPSVSTGGSAGKKS